MNARFVAALFLLAAPLAASAQVASEVKIGTDGVFTAKNVTVMQKAGTTIFARANWGTSFIRIGILTDSTTKFLKAHGELTSDAAVAAGDQIDVTGKLVMSSENLMLSASEIRDGALNQESKTLSGLVTSTGDGSFVMTDTKLGSTTVKITGAVLKKGDTDASLADLLVGDKVLQAAGSYDYATGIFSATEVDVYRAKEKFVEKNFKGILKDIAGTTLPTTLTLEVAGKDYTVHLDEKTAVVSNRRGKTSLQRFATGDTVRVYGTVGDRNPNDITAEVVRDTSF